MEPKEQIETILRELFSNHKTNRIPEFFASHYISHTSKKDYKGLKIVSQWIQNLNRFLSDLKLVKLEFIHETNDLVVWKRTIKGKIKPSKNKKLPVGKLIKWEEMIVSKFKGNQIVEEWISSEFLGALLPLGKK
ncbi:snoaL-like polyketide cyclase [Leptospira ellinghausenii]|uniref:SnoaL-like polyketide cyclase n=1 Tax=Leptospira ellinghausenii TaxID=1917822 RepID=A0A2P2DFH5_9LEPT|nr:ester cyclase [Leptospira ellinghausenii]GBF43386.1 snoaL-like polyketide cyclase [Leptospira ellinghausenii]